MAVWDCVVGVPRGSKGVAVRYRKVRDGEDPGAWVPLGTFTKPAFSVAIADDEGRIEIEALLIDGNGITQRQGRSQVVYPTAKPDSVRAIEDVTIPEPKVVQTDGATISIQTDRPVEEDPENSETEIRVGGSSSSAETATHVDFAADGEVVLATIPPNETSVKVYTRPVRPAEMEAPDTWAETTVPVAVPDVLPTEDFTDNFAGGDLEELVAGITPLEISSGDLRLVGVTYNDLGGVSLNGLGSVAFNDLGPLPTQGTFTTPNFTLPWTEDLLLQLAAELTSTGALDFSVNDLAHFPLCYPAKDANGDPADHKLQAMGFTLNGDATPIVCECKVATSPLASPTFVDADFKTHHPGKVYPAVRTYAVRVTIRSYFYRQITIDKLVVRRWIFCRTRPWCSHSRAFELIETVELAAPAGTVDFTFDGDQFDELALDLDWTQGDVTARQLYIRPNNDATSVYDEDGVGTTEVAIGATTVVQDETERARVSLYNAMSGGDERQFLVESNARYTATLASPPEASQSVLWKSTAAIASIRLTTAAPGTLHLAAGSVFRLWGKRRHQE